MKFRVSSVVWCALAAATLGSPLAEVTAFAPALGRIAATMTTTTSTQLWDARDDPTARLYNWSLERLAKKSIDDEKVEILLANYGERSRAYRRDIFTASDWVRTRRPDRFVDNVRNTFSSALIWQIGYEAGLIGAFSFFLVLYNELLVDGWTDLGGGEHEPLLHFLPCLQLPLVPWSLSIAALGLLLTFRTNVSYARWNEARTAWGKVINDSRSIARMGCTWARSYHNVDDAALQRLGEAICSFSRALMNRTLPPQEDGDNFDRYTEERLTDQSYAAALRDAKHRPTAALAELTQIIVDFKLNPVHQVEVEHVITGLCDALGASERIFTSPVPTFYTRHTARFLAVWLFSLPLGLYSAFGTTWNHLGMIPTTVVLGGFLLGIEELATQMEEPFSILPLEKMCEGSIRTPVMEQVERSQTGFYQPDTIVPVAGAKPPPTTYAAAVAAVSPPPPAPAAVQSPPPSYVPPPAPVEVPAPPVVPEVVSMAELNRRWANQSGTSGSSK
jgi:predicted membrane chloride channel (bestrophin family)